MRKKRIDSVSEHGEMVRSKAPEPPAHIKLPSESFPFWESIINARDYSLWTNPDLEMAAILARCKFDIERLSDEIKQEGDIVINARGTQIVNPKHSLLENLTRRAVALSRMLHVHAEATSGKAPHESKRNKKSKTIKDSDKSDPLIAQPIQ